MDFRDRLTLAVYHKLKRPDIAKKVEEIKKKYNLTDEDVNRLAKECYDEVMSE